MKQVQSGIALLALLGMGCAGAAAAQGGTTPQPGQGTAPSAATQTAPAPGAGAPFVRTPLPTPGVVKFPPVDPKNFTAPSPSVETVNKFLQAQWGFDNNRSWSVAAIEPTPAPGVVAVHVLVAEATQPTQIVQTTLYITPDGKHVIAGGVLPFGAEPFADTRALLQREADGPARGAAGKQLELVEFTDLDCPTCTAAQTTLDQLQEQFPGAHVVVEDMPQTRSHPLSYRAAAEGYCVRQAKGDAGYFTYAQAVRTVPGGLTAANLEETLNGAAKAAGADPAAVKACAGSDTTKAAVDAVVRLGSEAGVVELPTLFINGRGVPVGRVPVPVLAKLLLFQSKLDGLTVQQQPALSTLK